MKYVFRVHNAGQEADLRLLCIPCRPATNVVEHAKIDRDIQEIETEMGNKTSGGFSAAQKLYETGKNSLSGTEPRSIKGFSIKPEEPLGKLYADFKWDPHAFVAAVFEGQDSAEYGPFAKGSIANKVIVHVLYVQRTASNETNLF